jgi:SPP1 gp7 family putative phage head morphogenesis protein
LIRKKPKTLRAVRPSLGIEVAYRRKLDKLIEEMHNSIMYWVKAAYKSNEPEIAMDALPATDLQAAVRKLVRRWQRKFNEAAYQLADWFADDVNNRSDQQLKKILKDGGVSVQFKMTRAQQDILRATINQNVSLIKSIPQQYLGQVEGMVMRSVQTGRDLGDLSKDLQKQFGVTKRRAALIARDQNNKATSALQRARQIELGVTEAVWVHSHAGKTPRPTHVKMDGQKFDIKKGMWDPAVKKYILPGELINCRCVSKSVIPGFS